MDNILIKYRQLGNIFDCLSMGVIILSLDRRIIGFNKSAELITGRKESDIVGEYCYLLFKDYLCGGKCKFLERGKANKENLVEDVIITEEATDNFCITRIELPLYNASHRVIGCMEIFKDHSDFKELIKQIRFDDLRLELILDNLDIGILTVDHGNHVTFFNKMAEKITGYSRAETIGRNCSKILGNDFCNELIWNDNGYALEQAEYISEREIVTKQGGVIPIHLNFMVIRNEEDRIVGGLTTITDLSLKYHFKSVINERYTFYDMVGKDPAMRKIFGIVPVVAASDATILIEGPTGTGKDLLAKIIHNLSPREKKPFVKVNCASLPDTLLESEMFGYSKGAFTGAERDKPGRFNEANGGTIFLDEIGDMPLSLQAKLLRVLEDKEFYPLGSRKTSKVDVRIISATNQKLKELVERKRFREDLYYRLNVMSLELPPLNERKGDLPLLISHILKRLCAIRKTGVTRVGEEAMQILLNHEYPGNIRELENILEHALIICQGDVIEQKHLPISLIKNTKKHKVLKNFNRKKPDQDIDEKETILSMLDKFDWNKRKTARAMNIDRTTLWRKMKKYEIID